jgi:hypothetical protein
MSARVCRSCDYNVVSTVVEACPHCGEPLPRSLSASSSSLSMVGLALILIAGAAAWMMMRGSDGSRSAPPPVPPSTMAGPAATAAMPRTATARATAAPPGGADAEVARLVALLDDPTEGYGASLQLGKLDRPAARKALMAAYDSRDYGKMVGATAFYARTRPPGYEKVLVTLLHESRDLAVAQDLILSRDSQLAVPATKWAAEQGFKLVKSTETPTGVTWTSVSNPGQ